MRMCLSGKTEYGNGFVLVAVMWVIILLTIITAVIAQTSRLDTRVAVVSAEQMRCKWACRAGVETAVAVLNDDGRKNDSFDDMWYDNTEDFNNVSLDGCSFTVEVVDEAGKLNINTATKKQLMELPEMTEPIANSILDWRDKDDRIRNGGAESGYYMNLPHGYKIRNGQFRTIRELLLVKDVAPEMLYGSSKDRFGDNNDIGWIRHLTCYSYDRNKDGRGNKRINVNKAGENKLARELKIRKSYAKWIVENRKKGFKSIGDLITKNCREKPNKATKNSKKAEPLDLETFFKIVERVTVTDDKTIAGMVNVNTASKAVLTALFEGKEHIAEDIITSRESLPGGISGVGNLRNVNSMKKAETVKKYIGQLTTRSSVFTIYSRAKTDMTGRTQTSEVVVDRGKSPTEILYCCAGAKI